MVSPKTLDEIQLEVLEWLKGTRYASTSLESLLGGQANFIYRAHLFKPLADGTTDVVVKHGEGHMARHPTNKLTTHRCRIEAECLKEVVSFRIIPDIGDTFKYVVRTPECYLYDDVTHTKIMEYPRSGINLRAFALKNFPSPTPESFRPQCHQLGKALVQYITGFHLKTRKDVKDWVRKGRHGPESKLYSDLRSNKEMQELKQMINFGWLLERIDLFPGILEEARDVFEKVREEAVNGLEVNPEDLVCIHGDFWTGNVVLSDAPIEEGVETPIFVIDWENAQLGVQATDHGQMLGQMYLLWAYKKIDAGLWMLQGYAEGLGEQTATDTWRNAIYMGVHLLSFGTVIPDRGTPEQVEDVARLGRDLIMNAWARNREWFEKSEFACLCSRTTL